MKPSEFYFCLHNGTVRDEDEDITIITFCPTKYWDDKECLPEYSFYEEIENIVPSEYLDLGFSEETQRYSKDTEESIRQKLKEIGFVENFAMQKFLSECWA